MRMPVSPAAWSSSSVTSLGGGGAGGGGEVVIAVDGGGGEGGFLSFSTAPATTPPPPNPPPPPTLPLPNPHPHPDQAGAQGLQAGTQLVGGNAWKIVAPAIIGCACAIACYLSMRQLVALRMRPSRGSGPHDHCGLPSDASRKRRKNALACSSSIPPTCYNRPADRDTVR